VAINGAAITVSGTNYTINIDPTVGLKISNSINNQAVQLTDGYLAIVGQGVMSNYSGRFRAADFNIGRTPGWSINGDVSSSSGGVRIWKDSTLNCSISADDSYPGGRLNLLPGTAHLSPGAPDGQLSVSSVNGSLYLRKGGTWREVALI
jgi:hypothetical protein